jgi:hypothetical protein
MRVTRRLKKESRKGISLSPMKKMQGGRAKGLKQTKGGRAEKCKAVELKVKKM